MGLRLQYAVPQDVTTAEVAAPADDGGADDAGAPADGHDAVVTAADADRFTRLVTPHLKDAYTLARWITGNRIDAEDVVQEACLRTLRVIGATTDDNARAWTLRAVRNAAFAWLRKFRPAALVTPDEFGPIEREQLRSWESDSETPEVALIVKADTADLEAAIAALPAPFREALVLRDIQGLSYREIAEVTGVPIGTVMSRLARGRSRVIKLIERRSQHRPGALARRARTLGRARV